MNKKCVVCDEEFDTPGIRCHSCREAAAPKIVRPNFHLPYDYLSLISNVALRSKGKEKE